MLTTCKACNITQNGMINIYEHPNKLDVMFINITGIAEILLTDALCITCYDELKVAHNFKQKCLQTEIVRGSFRKLSSPNPTPTITITTESMYAKYNTYDQPQSDDEIEIIQLLSDHQTETDDDVQINVKQYQENNNNNIKYSASDKIKDDINLQTTIKNQADNSEFDDNECEQIKNIVVNKNNNNNNNNNDIEEFPLVQHKIDNVKNDCEHNDNDIVIDIDDKGEDKKIISNNYKNIEIDLTCTKCKKTFPTNISYKRHLKEMHSIDIRKSSKLGRNKHRRGPSPKLLENGENIFATLKDTQCEYCFANFETAEKMLGHTQMHTNEEKPYKCYRENCSSHFKNRIGLRKHIEIHSSIKRYKCKYCDHRFHQRCNAKSHERYHTGEKPFLCPHCDKAFAESGNLKSHIRFHTGERPYACPHCPKTFTTHYAHKIHIRSHTQERPYKCSVCGKSFNSSGKLVVHKRIHSGVRPYKCGVCVATFIDSTGLKRHMKIH